MEAPRLSHNKGRRQAGNRIRLAWVPRRRDSAPWPGHGGSDTA